VFVTAAGPFAWHPSKRPGYHKEVASSIWCGTPWTDWHLDGFVVRFPKCDILKTLAALRNNLDAVRHFVNTWNGVPDMHPPRELRTCE